MKLMTGWRTATALFLIFAAGSSALAQGPGGPGGFQMPPQFAAWQKWRASHPNITSLGQTIRALGQIEQNPATKLNKAQAKVILAVINKWRNKPVMSDAQARAVNSQITGQLTIPQIKQLAILGSQRRGFGGGGGFGGGRPGGGGGGFGGGQGGGGGRPGGPPAGFTIPAPHDYNPLNPSTSPFTRSRPMATQRFNQLLTALSQTK